MTNLVVLESDPYYSALQSPFASIGRNEAETALSNLNSVVKTCTACSDLALRRTQTVFGVGNPQPELCFIGEAPGADEDRLGEPFVGLAGQLLNKMIAAIGLKREEVYILNILKCRPPGNRRPTPEETSACWPFLRTQLSILRPRVICALGATAAQNLLKTQASTTSLRLKPHQFNGIPLIVTYHPSYLLRTPEKKVDAWLDLKFLMKTMGKPLPPKQNHEEAQHTTH